MHRSDVHSRGHASLLGMSVLPVSALMGKLTFMPSKEAMRSSVPHTFSNAEMIPGCLRFTLSKWFRLKSVIPTCESSKRNSRDRCYIGHRDLSRARMASVRLSMLTCFRA